MISSQTVRESDFTGDLEITFFMVTTVNHFVVRNGVYFSDPLLACVCICLLKQGLTRQPDWIHSVVEATLKLVSGSLNAEIPGVCHVHPRLFSTSFMY